ncbi:2-C-methyl-D-erythritol 4-phosphate cytidylyltransferase [Stackebrandtia soli]|uniref:2-C-methyl-D-erythritol 4-phosphate cytidylyltransferase n=1 Tax=Stackebrandtia soli TaxID=1892856 RepID=UPI0039EC9433
MTRTVAVLLAGGTGRRMGADVPKQLLDVAGKPILAHTLDVFTAARSVDDIVVLMPAEHVDAARRIIDHYGYSVRHLGPGGATRDASTRAALGVLADEDPDTKVLIHDAVRPLVTVDQVDACAAILDRFDAATLAVPTTDTIVGVSSNGDVDLVTDLPDRAGLRRVQTPQAFRLGLLARCHEAAVTDTGFVPTDDCGVVRRYAPDVPIAVVAGSDDNIKVTHPQDVDLADRLLRDRTL